MNDLPEPKKKKRCPKCGITLPWHTESCPTLKEEVTLEEILDGIEDDGQREVEDSL